MRIDSHQHFWRYEPAEFGWLDASMAALRRDFLPPDLKPRLDENGIDGCVSVQTSQTPGETRFLLELARQHAWIRGVVGWVDLRSPDVDAELRGFARDPCFVGVRHIAQAEPDPRFLLGDAFQRGIAALARHDLVYDILVFWHQLPAAVELAARFPGQRFVLDHCGKPPFRGSDLAAWERDLRALARTGNVACKVSGLATEAGPAWTPARLEPVLDVVWDAFGPERLLFGSDWPVCLATTDYRRWFDTVQAWLARHPEAQRSAVLGGNCARIYRLVERRRAGPV